jgi:predicted Zn-dependent protease
MVIDMGPVAPTELRTGTSSPDPAGASSDEQARLSRIQNDLVNAGDLDGAERLLTTWLAAHPSRDNHLARLELARIHFWRGRPRQARTLLEALRRERPEDTWVASFLGQVLARFGEREGARALFHDALARDGANHEARLFLGGDDLGHTQQQRKMLAHRALSPRGTIELALLCAALDFRRGDGRSSLAEGELTQAAFDRANLTLRTQRLRSSPGKDSVNLPAAAAAEPQPHQDRALV